jgi:hypothetical protein
MFSCRFPVPPWSRARLIARIFGKRVPYVVPEPAQGMINTIQGIAFATGREKGHTRQQTDGEEPIHYVTAIWSSSCLFRRIPA